LDEPTSNLDAESEAIFSKVISRIRDNTNTTIIIVSHRLESISDADNIIVLNHGKVESSGVHVELLRENGWYAKAWNSK
jgi:ATP-binding cassette subfamily B protein